MSLSVRTRFEVFKRDRFSCRYCGKTPPDILLEVDHIIPRAAGGSDDMDNLTTSCADCNRGKSDRLLEEGTRPTVGQRDIADLQERIAQAQAYAELVQTFGDLHSKQYQMFVSAWARAFNATATERDDGSYWVLPSAHDVWPNAQTIRLFLQKIPLQTIIEAVDIAASRFGVSSDATCRYFYAICWRRIRDAASAVDPLHDDPEGREDEVVALHIRLGRLEDENAALLDQIDDLNRTVRRYREREGRE